MNSTTFYNIQLTDIDDDKSVFEEHDNAYHLACFKISSTPDKFWLDIFKMVLDEEGELKRGRILKIEKNRLYAGNYSIEKYELQDRLDDFNKLFSMVNVIATESKLEKLSNP